MKISSLLLNGRLPAILFVAVGLFFVASCGGDDDGEPAPTQTLFEILESRDDLKQLETFIAANQNLSAVLKGATEYTFFAPSDDAFEKLKNLLGVTDLTTVNPEIITAVLSFHVSEIAKISSELTSGTTLTTLQGEKISINENGTIKEGGRDEEVEILNLDIKATNGVMHIVETILIPPTIYSNIKINLGKASQPLLLGADFTTLAAAINKADAYVANQTVLPDLKSITEILIDANAQLTVFAPTNGVFTAASITLDTYDGQTWYSIIANHVLSEEVKAASFTTAGEMYESKAGYNITVLATDAPTDPAKGILTGIVLDSTGDTAPEGQIAVGDVFDAENGVVHVFAGVLAIPQ